MKRHTSITLAAGALCGVAMLLAVYLTAAPSYARYETTAKWSAVYAPQKAEVTASSLAAGGQTVLLDDWRMDSSASRMEEITLTTKTGSAEGTISCRVDKEAYVTAALSASACQVSSAGLSVQLTLNPTQAALSLTQAEEITVHVGWTDSGKAEETLWADYRVRLLPAGTAEVAAPGGTAAAISVTATENFAWAELLAVHVTAPEQADTLVLQMNGGRFPEGTRYWKVDGAPVMLGDSMDLTVDIAPSETVELLLDLSRIEQPDSTQVVLLAKTLCEGVLTGEGQTAATADRMALAIDTTGIEPVIRGSGVLEIALPEDTTGLSWRLLKRVRGESAIAYTEAEDQFGLTVTTKEQTEGDQTKKYLAVSNEAGVATAGSYLLVIERGQEQRILTAVEIPFFLCY